MKNVKFFGVLLVVLLSGFIFGSCEIGLGSAVDTEPPSVSIETPGVDVVIRDSFAIRGTWSDDGEIDSLTAVLERTDGNGSPISFVGEVFVNEDDNYSGSWKIIVDPVSQGILDGTYQLTLSIKDKGEHTTIQTRTFTIDNTAPLIVLQRPSSKSEATSIDSYGQSFTLTGQAADDNDVSHIYVNIYEDKDCTKFLRTVDLANVPPTIELDVAKFEENVDNDYSGIYGFSSKGHGTVGRYCTIMAYDGSQRYPIEGEQSEADKLGNATNVYYLYNDIATAILSETKITEVYHMLDGSYLQNNSSRSAVVDNVKQILEENKITIGSFSLNPDNNPLYTVSGQSPLSCTGTDFTADQSHYISNGLTVVVEVSPGLDAIPLDADSLKVYFQECDLNGQPLADVDKIYSDGTYTLSGSNYKFETIVSTTVGLRVGANYLFGVDGTDQKGNEVKPKSSKYGFHLASNASAPILTVTSPSESLSYRKKGDSQLFQGTVSVEEGKPTISIYIGNNTYYSHTVTDADLISSEEGKLYSFNFTVPAGTNGFDQNTSNQYGFIVKASLEDLYSAENRTIIYDVDPPIINFQQITPTAYKYLDESGGRETISTSDTEYKKYLNGIIESVRFTISDAKSGVDVTNNIAKCEFFLGNSTVASNSIDINDPYSPEIGNIDTTLWKNPDNSYYVGPVTLKVTAYDIAGNVSVTEKEYYVDQETDNPVILPYSTETASFLITSAGTETNGINFGAGTENKNKKNIAVNGSQYNLKLIDDDGISNLKYYYKKVTVNTNDYSFTPVTDFGNPKGEFTDYAQSTETTYPCNLPSESGYYQFKVVVTDKNGNETTKGPFMIKTTPAGAEIVVTSDKTHIKQGSGASFTNRIDIPSDQAPFDVYRKLKNEENWTKIHTIAAENNIFEYSYDDVVTPTDTTTYNYKVIDANEHDSNTYEIKCTVDGGRPTVNLESGLPNKEKTKLSSFTFKGTASDTATSGHTTDSPSGVQKILLTIANGTNSSASNYKYRTVTVTGTSDWYYELSFNDETPYSNETGASGNKWSEVFSEGTKYVTITVIDKVGNESNDYINQAFVFDKSNPELSINSSSVRNFIPTGGYDITGTASDTLGLASLVIKERFMESNASTYGEYSSPVPITVTGTSWSAHIPFNSTNLIDGTYSYMIIATDSVGNTVSWSKDGIKVDTTAPEVIIEKPDEYWHSDSYEFKGFIGEKNKDSCKATLQKMNTSSQWEDIANTTVDLSVDSSITNNTDINWQQKFFDLSDIKYRVKIEAVDQANNSTTDYSDPVIIDTTAPKTSVKGTSLYKDDGTVLNTSTDISEDDDPIFYAKSGFTLSGTITEENFNKSLITFKEKKDDNSPVTKDLTWNGKNWSYNFTSSATNGRDDGTYKYTLTVIDKASNRKEYVINVTYDTQAPTLTIDEPGNNDKFATASIPARGNIKDAGIGLSEFKYSVKDGAEGTWENYPIAKNASSWSQTFTPTDEGELKLKMKAKDLLGHEVITDTVRFSYDKEPPHVISNSVSEYVTSGNLVLSGKAWDSNKLTDISILDECNGVQKTYTETSTPAIVISGHTKEEAKNETTAVTWTLTLPVTGNNAITNGSHTFTITAKDDAARTTTPDKIIVKVDTVAPKMTLEALPSRTDTQAASFTFRGEGSDLTSGVEKVELTISNANNSKYRTVKVTGKENWYYSVIYDDDTLYSNETGASGDKWSEVFADEGEKKVTLKIIDKAGLENTNFKLEGDSTESSSKTFIFDKANPVITLNQDTILEYMPESGFTIEGAVSDSYKLSGSTEGIGCVTVEEFYKQNISDAWPTAAQQTQTFDATNINNHSGDISIHVPLNNGATVDGRYKYKITVKDSMDNKGTYSTSDQGIIVDKTAPTVTITTPSSNTSHTDENAIHEQSFKFIGGFTEANEISGIYYKIIKSGTTAPTVPTSNVILENTWIEAGFTKVTAGSSTWNSFQSFTTGNTGDFCEGENYKIYVYGVDKATNVSSATICTFDVDMSAPEIKTQIKETGGTYTDLTVDSTQIKTKTYEFRYYAKDTYGINGSETVVVKKDGDELGTTTSTTAPYYAIGTADVDGYKVITITVPDGVKQDGLYEYTISATDKVGKHTEVNRSIRLDRFGPEVTVQSPDLTGYQNNESITVSGSSDDDSGTLAVYYAYGVSSVPVTPAKGTAAKTAANWTGWTAATGTTSWNFTVTGVEAQSKNLYIVAVDKNGLYENPISKVVRVDKSDPSSTFTKPNAYEKGTLVLTGTVWDANGIKEVKVSYGTNGSYSNEDYPQILISGTNYQAQTNTNAIAKLTAAKADSSKATWKSSLASLADGKYNFKIEIKDDAGKIRTEVCEVVVDKTNPTITGVKLDWGLATENAEQKAAENSKTLHARSTAKLSFNVNEENIKSVSYYINNKSNSTITSYSSSNIQWSSISSDSSAYSTNLTFGDGDGDIYIKVEDMAGNVSYGATQTYDVDTTKPDVCRIDTVNNNPVTESGITINGRENVTFTVIATDINARYVNYVQKGADPAQIGSVNLYSIGSTASSADGTISDSDTGKWEIVIPASAFESLDTGSKGVSVTVTDKAGNSQNFTNLFTLTLDKTSPTVGIATPKDAGDDSGTQVNGTIKLEGTAKDTGGSELSSIDICYYVNNEWHWHSRLTQNLSNWTSTDIDTTTLAADGTEVTFVAIATDTAGNRNTDESGVDKTVAVTGGLKPASDVLPTSISNAVKVEVDQDTDRPTVKFTNLNEENGSYVLKYGTNSIMEGTLSDDDSTESAVVATFIVSNEEITNTTGWTITPNATGDTITSTKANCGTTVFNKKTGSYTFTPAVTTDGSKTVYFYLVDNGGKIYYTGNTGTLNQPYQQYKTDAKADNSVAITYLSDSTAPTIHKVYAHAYKDSTKEDEDIALGTSCIVGGTERNGIELVVEATDENAITKIVVELDDGTEADKKTYTYTGTNITSYNEAGVTYYKATMPKKVLSTAFPAITSTSERDYVDVTVTVYDGAGLYSNQSSQFVIDLKAPTFEVSQPAEGSILYGVNENKVTGVPSATDVSKFYYYVTKAANTTIADNDWKEIGGTSKMSKTLVFDGGNGTAYPVDSHEDNKGWHCKTLREWVKTAYNVEEATLTVDDTNKDLYIRFKLVDNCGNIGYSSRKFVIIPNGDMPTLEVTYPLADAKLGGTIRCTGTTEIYTDEISGVYAQIDVSGAMTANWESTLTAKTSKYTIVDTGVVSGDYTRGIKVSGSPYSWNFSINGSSEFNDVENGKVAIRFFAVSTQNHKVSPVGTDQTRIITIDANAPIFNSMRLVQFAADGTTIIASKAYEEDMWITGQWYIYGNITDDNGVKSITYEDTSEHALVEQVTGNELSGDITTTSPYSGYVIQGTTNHANVAGNKAYDYTLRIPIGSSESNKFGQIKYTVKAIDATNENNSSQKIFIVNYDNKAPEFKATVSAAANAAELATTGIEIRQSNAGYSFNGQFNEEGNAAGNQSGFGRILMYFTRTLGSTTSIIDVSTTKVKSTGTNDNKNNYLALTGLTSEPDGYWKSATANISAENTLAVTGLPTFARKGGVVKIDNVLYKITSISGTTVKVDGVLSNDTGKTVYFTPALVIDNLSTESVKEGVTYTGIYSTADDSTSLTNGDGDWLIEGVNKSGASYPWTAMINSTNILDGPITVHFVAYDAAGNMVTKSYSGNVANNAPRVAGVTIWNDYNGDGTGWRSNQAGFADETVSYYADRVGATINGKTESRSKSVVDKLIASSDGTASGKSIMKITDQIKIIPEIIGGNGSLGYTYEIKSPNPADTNAILKNTSGLPLKNDSGTQIQGTDDGYNPPTETDTNSLTYIVGHTDGVISFPAENKAAAGGQPAVTGVINKLHNSTSDQPTWFNIKIWDSTEGATQYSNSLNCEMDIALMIAYTDNTSPLTYMDDLFWNGSESGKNSVYVDPSNDQLKGHVELKGGITTGSTLATTYGTDDDKVSGIVVFRGTAYDNKRLNSLSWGIKSAVTGTDDNQAWPQTYAGSITYNPTTAEWSTAGNINIGNPFYYFHVVEDEGYYNKNGHKVNWELIIDTSYVQQPGHEDGTQWGVGKDLYVYVGATDTASQSTDTNLAATSHVTDKTTRGDEELLRPWYKVDVVPYITGMATRLSDPRSSNGHYQIAKNEKIQLKGYNLAPGNANSGDITITKKNDTQTGTGVTIDASGNLSITRHGCVSINNMNTNTLYGSIKNDDYNSWNKTKQSTNSYNMQATSTNYSLTDDVQIDIWDFNSKAVKTVIDHAMISQPVMKYNSSTGNLGFAFSDGPNAFSMPTGTADSYNYWEKNYAKYIQSNFVFDNVGRSIAISVGIDTYPEADSCKSGRMNLFYSQWGESGQGVNGNFSGTNSIHLDAIGQGDQDIREDRFGGSNPIAMALAHHTGTNADRTLYIAYYDQINSRIVFRYGRMQDSKDAAWPQTGMNNSQTANNIVYNQLYHNGDGERGFTVDASQYSIIANGTNGYNAAEFVDLAVITGASRTADTVCIVWYTGSSLMYSYKTNPCNDYDLGTTGNGGRWSEPETLLTNGGKYCKIKTDANGGIHIAAFDGSSNGLAYFYKPSYSGTTTKVIVDAANGPYDEIFLDVATDSSSKAVPSIGYYANGKVKMAIYEKGITASTGTPEQSWDSTLNSFTGKWDVCFVPTSAQFSKADHINVALPKNTSGVRTNVSVSGTTKGFTETGDAGSGTVGGNGTLNAILGYAVYNNTDKQGYIEIAQRQ